MSQQGERRTGRDDDWWGQLYDEATQDAGPAPAQDTLDDRFASAADAVQEANATQQAAPAGPAPERPAPAGPAPERPASAGPAPERPAPAGPAPDRPASAGPAPAAPAPVPAQRSGDSPGGAPPGGASPGGDLPKTPPEPPAKTPPEPPAKTPPEAPAETPPETPPEAPRTAPADAASVGVTPPVSPARPAAGPSAGTPGVLAPWEPPAGPGGPVTFGSGAGPAVAGADLSPPGGPGGLRGAEPRPAGTGYVGDGPPTYEAEPTALPAADPDDLGDLVADTVLDGARYGTWTLRAASLRGDSARYRGEPRRDSLLTARFGSGDDALLLVAMATGARATPGAHRAAAEACAWIGGAVGRSHRRLAEDIRAARRGDLKSGLHRLTDRSLGRLRAHAADLGLDPGEYAASLRCLLLPADPRCRTRVFFGVGAGGLFRLRDGAWQDIEPRVADATGEAVVGFGSPPPRTAEGDRLTMDLNITTPPSPYERAAEPPREPFRFRASVARPGDTLLLCSGGLAEPLRGEPELPEHLIRRWHKSGPPGLADFLADVQVRAKGYADDRTAAGVWEA